MVTSAQEVQMDQKGLDNVKALFNKQIDQGLHPGAAMAVYRHGKLVLDLYGGIANSETNKKVDKDTLFVIFSCTKALAAFCSHIMWSRGMIELGHWMYEYWPEFANNGKEDVEVRHILTHTGGFPDTPPELTPDKMTDWDAAVRAMENAKPKYKPGEVISYHSLNFGWVIGEVIRRIDGRPISQFLKEEITQPLGMNDFYLGLPADQENRVAKMDWMVEEEKPELVELFNRPEFHQAVIPAANGISTARDLARFYAMLSMGGTLDGVDIVRPGIVRGMAVLQEEGDDIGNDRYVKLGLGFALDDPAMGQHRGDERYGVTFGHGGLGSSIAWVEPDERLAVAIITNGVRDRASNTKRLAELSDAVKQACL
jgi:CubicO group peptidase (beta-lactamase class C family)